MENEQSWRKWSKNILGPIWAVWPDLGPGYFFRKSEFVTFLDLLKANLMQKIRKKMMGSMRTFVTDETDRRTGGGYFKGPNKTVGPISRLWKIIDPFPFFLSLIKLLNASCSKNYITSWSRITSSPDTSLVSDQVILVEISYFLLLMKFMRHSIRTCLEVRSVFLHM